jgi:hypothetical protein
MKRTLAALGLTLLFTTAGEVSVRAEQPTAKQEADALYQEGIKLFDAQKYEAAREKFAAGYERFKSPKLLINVAVSEKRAGQLAQAARHFRAVIRLYPKFERIPDAEKSLKEILPKLGGITLDAPEGGEIFIDAAPFGETTPFRDPIDLDPGSHTIEVRKGTKVGRATVNPGAGDLVPVRIAQLEEPPAPPAPTHKAPVSVAPPPPQATPAPHAPETPAPAESNTRTIVLWTSSGVALVSAVVGTVFAFKASDAIDRQRGFQTSNPPGTCDRGVSSPLCDEWRDATEARARNINITRVAFGVAGLGAAVFVTALLWPKSDAKSGNAVRARLSPVFGLGGAGAQLEGSF